MPLNELPADILVNHVFKHLAPNDIAALRGVSRGMRETVGSPRHWQNKLESNFPHVLKTLTDKTKVYNYEEIFKNAYKKDYRGLKKRQRNLFSFVKDGDIKSIRENAPRVEEFFNKTDRNDKNLIDWAAENRQQFILNYLFNLVKQESFFSSENLATNPNNKDFFDLTLLHWAVLCRQFSDVKSLLTMHADPKSSCNFCLGSNKNPYRGQQPLHIASKNGDLDLVRAILEHDASTLDEETGDGETPLLLASQHGRIEVVDYLLKKNPNLECATRNPAWTAWHWPNRNTSRTALHWALENGHQAVAEKLVTKGANPRIRMDIANKNALVFAARRGYLDVVKAILRYHPSTIDINKRRGGWTVLTLAISSGNADLVDYLLENNAIVEYRELAVAISVNSSPAIINKLIAEWSNQIRGIGYNQDQPLHIAAKKGNLALVKAIVKYDSASLDAQDGFGLTALTWARREEHSDVVEYLCEAQADARPQSSKNKVKPSQGEKLDRLIQEILLIQEKDQNKYKHYDLLQTLKAEAKKMYKDSNLSLQNRHQQLRQMHDRFKQLDGLYAELNELSLQAQNLRQRNFFTSSRLVSDVAESLVQDIERHAKRYMTDTSPSAYTTFKNACDADIVKASKVLNRHRAFKCLLGNIALFILGLGVGYLIACGVNKAVTGNYLFFSKTHSQEIVEDVSEAIEHLRP